MSDLDAIWLRNPFVEVEKHYRSQVIASRAEFPEDVSRRYVLMLIDMFRGLYLCYVVTIFHIEWCIRKP